MKKYFVASAALAVAVILFAQAPGPATGPTATQAVPASAAQQSLPWAFAVAPGRGGAGRGAGGPSGASAASGGRGPADDGTLRHVPGSPVGFTLTQIRDMYNVVDWFPGSHPPYPDIDIHGRRPGVGGCGYCHLPTGFGRPENAPIAGLTADYIIQQLADFKTAARKGSEPRLNGPTQMTNLAKNATDEEIRNAAEYFSNASFKGWIRAVETDTVPVTHVSGGMLAPVDPPATEPIGTRIIEVPESFERTEIRDTSSRFIAYVPKGSIEKGRVLATAGGNGKTVPCIYCHGNDLKGLGWVPPLAGRSPSYLARQIFDFQQGTRAGKNAFLMKGAVEKLTVEDIVNVIAYAVSRQP
jgi:cytochrome c553